MSRRFRRVGVFSFLFFKKCGFTCCLEPLPDPTKFAKREGEAEKQARRRKHADMEAEYNAVTCVAVYMLLMSFSQKGIDKLRNFQEHMKMRHPDGDFVVSEGFDDGSVASPLLTVKDFNSRWLCFSVELVQGALHQMQ